MSYAVGINERKMPQTLYWGPRLAEDASLAAALPPAEMQPEVASFDTPMTTTPLEYAGWGGGLAYEPALKASFPDGDRSLTLEFVEAAMPAADTLVLTTRDAVHGITVELHYRVYAQGVLARWAVIRNGGETPAMLEQAAAATWNLPSREDYRLSWLTGHWAGEWQLHRQPVQTGSTVLESRRGSTSHQANPWFSLATTGTTEAAGPVWFGELGWSGSWRINVEETGEHAVRVTGGYNPFDFGYKLAPRQSLTTPIFYAGYTARGEGGASRILHRLQLEAIVPQAPAPRPRPVIFNSWEATEFSVDEAGQIALAEKAAKLGVERMVIDDGWFGQRITDHAGLGDWYVNPQKFPHGLKPVIDRTHALGMDFGIWVEPEMVNPNSDLYRRHPDWAMHFPGRPGTQQRNQLMLNLARPDVKDYVFKFLDDLVSNNDIAFLKWDYNRNWSEPGWETVPLDQQKEIYVKYVENLYAILDALRRKHPRLEIESCSGGGGRVDLGILRYTDEVWPSDNTDALDRLTIQNGFTQAYAPELMMAWVTDVPNFADHRVVPLSFRFLVAMTGSLGIGGNLNHWTDAEMATATQLVAFYKTVRTTVQQGSLYRLMANPDAPGHWATEYVSQDGAQAVLFGFLHSQQFGEPFPVVRLAGLDPAALYQVKPLDASKTPGMAAEMSGSALMGEGLRMALIGDYDATAVVLERVK
jgi:alpha-galactosidase